MRSKGQIVVLGAGGMLGSELCRQLGGQAIGLRRADLNLCESERVIAVLRELKPYAVINAAAFTAVDRAEQEPDVCRAINSSTVAVLASACRELDCKLVQVSTDYVFGGDRVRATPYRETDEPSPLSIYAHSKLEGEMHTAKWDKHFIVRTCGLYGRRTAPSQRHFVDTMLQLGRDRDRLRIVNDQRCTPTAISEFVRGILFLLSSEAFGTYHLVNRGETTWYDFAVEIFRLAKIPVRVDPISSAEFAALAARPTYSVLDTTKYHALGGPQMDAWQDALASYLTAHA
jgi:dTDP-4-dehydrorhamnose reductase